MSEAESLLDLPEFVPDESHGNCSIDSHICCACHYARWSDFCMGHAHIKQHK
jgi:hypothetical protein